MSVVSASSVACGTAPSMGAAACWSVIGPPRRSGPAQYPCPGRPAWPTCDDGRMTARHRKRSAAAPPGYFAWVAAGTFDSAEPASRLHGDLWSGNVLWTAREAVLIDPAAHGGHRETDLAMLALFGAPH